MPRTRKTPFSKILEWLNVSIKTFTTEADRVAKERNDRLEIIKYRTGKDYEESPLIGIRNMGEYSSGQRTLPRDPQLQERIFDTFVYFFEKRYDALNKENYVQLTTQFINNLSSGYPLDPAIFDYDKYCKMIGSESLPDDLDEFRYFIQRSCFMDFLNAFVKSWDVIKKLPDEDQSFRKGSLPKKASLENISFFADKAESYMPQSLTDDEGNTVLLNDPDDPDNLHSNLLYLVKHKLVLITGPGGQGKSTFLKMLRVMNLRCKTFDKVILIPLVSLTSIDMDYRGDDFNIITDYILHQYPDVQFNDAKQKVLILLDGFNEYRTSKNHQAVENITGSLTELIDRITTKGEDSNESLVITTRDLHTTVNIFPVFQHFQALSLSGTSDSEYRLIRSMCENKGVDFDGTELANLAETPLYARFCCDSIVCLRKQKFENSGIKTRILQTEEFSQIFFHSSVFCILQSIAKADIVFFYVYLIAESKNISQTDTVDNLRRSAAIHLVGENVIQPLGIIRIQCLHAFALI